MPKSPTAPRPPPPTRVVGVEFLSESNEERKSIEFLQGCYPAIDVKASKIEQDIKTYFIFST